MGRPKVRDFLIYRAQFLVQFAQFCKTKMFLPLAFLLHGVAASADRRRVTMEVPIWGPVGTNQTHSRVEFSQTRRAQGPPRDPVCMLRCYVGG